MVQYEITRRKGHGQRYSSASSFSTRIVCGECGGYYGSKVWQSNNKYRKVVWRCNDKYKNANGEAACHTPHLSEDEIKTAFIGAFNSCIKNKKEIIAACEEAIATVCDTAQIEAEIERLNDELEVTTELIRKCIDENAHISVKPEIYEEKYRSLIERYEAAKEKLDNLESELAERKSRKEKIDIFLKELSKKKELLTEFDEGLWSIMVDTMTVYSKDRVVFKFRDGTTVEWQIRKTQA